MWAVKNHHFYQKIKILFENKAVKLKYTVMKMSILGRKLNVGPAILC
jgi:hypothetical protein